MSGHGHVYLWRSEGNMEEWHIFYSGMYYSAAGNDSILMSQHHSVFK